MPIITDRDRAILWSLGTTRVLSAQEIEWLHFPGWEERERLHNDQTPNEAVRRPAGVHRRIRVLQKAGLLRWMIRPMITSDRNTKKLPLLHSLTQRGKNYLQDVMENDADTLWAFPETQQPNLENMDHSYLIGRTYAALAAGSARDGHALTDWLGDHLLVKGYDRLAVAGYREKLPMLPDASGVLVTEALHRRFFVEVDRGTMAIARWREKIAAQHTYRNSRELHMRYATTTFFTCIVAPSARRLLRIAEAVARGDTRAGLCVSVHNP